MHVQAIKIVLSIYCVNSTKCKLESNYHSKYPGQNIVYVMFFVFEKGDLLILETIDQIQHAESVVKSF